MNKKLNLTLLFIYLAFVTMFINFVLVPVGGAPDMTMTKIAGVFIFIGLSILLLDIYCYFNKKGD